MTKEELKELRIFWEFVRRYWKRLLHVMFWMAVVAGLRLPMPLFTKVVVDEGLIARNMSLINWMALAFIAFLVLNFTSNVAKTYFSILFRERIVYDIKMTVFRHVMSLPHAFFQGRSTGYLMARVAGDAAKVESLLSDSMLGILLDLMTLVAGLGIMFFFHWKLTLLCLGLLPFYIMSLMAFGERIKRDSRRVQENQARVSQSLQEGLAGYSVIKCFRREKHQSLRFSHRLRDAIKARIKLTMRMTLSTSTTMSIGSAAPLLVLWYGGHEVLQGNLTIGEMMAFSGFLSYVFGPTQKIVNLNFVIKESLAAFERILELLTQKPAIADRDGSRDVAAISGRVRYENVSFSYDGETPALKGVSCEIEPGCITALVGRSGAGKSTFLNLLPRFFDPVDGKIYIDEIPIEEFTLRSLRSHIGLVLQDTFLFDGTIEDNIRYGRLRASPDEIRDAVSAANVCEFVDDLPNGLATRVGERGSRLSGGQRQRICIARVILSGARILVFDEATSQLDSESDTLIQKTLLNIKPEKTILVIAHRLSTVFNADRIIVLENGSIVGEGTHHELYEENAHYRVIFERQFNAEPSASNDPENYAVTSVGAGDGRTDDVP